MTIGVLRIQKEIEEEEISYGDTCERLRVSKAVVTGLKALPSGFNSVPIGFNPMPIGFKAMPIGF